MKPRIRIILLVFLTAFLAGTVSAAECPESWRSMIGLSAGETNVGGCGLVQCQIETDLAVYEFKCPFVEGAQRMLLTPKSSAPAMSSSRSFNMVFQGRIASEDKNSEDLRNFTAEFSRRVIAGDDGSLKLAKALPPGWRAEKAAGKEGWLEVDRWLGSISKLGLPAETTTMLRNMEIYASGISIALFVLLFVLRSGYSIRTVFRLWGLRILLAVMGFSLLALLAGFIAPQRMVMYFSGYGIINDAAALYIGKYGAGAPLLYHALFKIFPGSTESFIRFNLVLGIMTIPAAAFWLSTRLKDGRAAVVAAAIFALHPMFIKDRNSESILVACLFFFFWGHLFFDAWLAERKRLDGLAAFFSFASALFTRPEFVVFIPLSILLLPKNNAQLARRCCGFPAVSAWVILTIIHLAWIALFALAEWQWQPDAVWMPIQRNIVAVLIGTGLFFTHLNLFVLPHFTPLVLPLAAIAAFILTDKTERRTLLSLLLMGIALFSFYFLDQPGPSRPRLQMPAQYFFCFISVAGLQSLYEYAKSVRFMSKKTFATVAVILLLASFMLPHFYIWRTDNTVAEDAALMEIPTVLPHAEKSVLVVFRGEDKKEAGIFYNYPEYELRRNGEVDLYGTSRYIQTYKTVKTPAYFYLGMRCYVRLAWMHTRDNTKADYMNDECRRMLDKFKMDPLKTWRVDNVNDGFGLYPQTDKIEIGLYRITGKK